MNPWHLKDKDPHDSPWQKEELPMLLGLCTKESHLWVARKRGWLVKIESTIALQLSGLRHAVLIGDERQLPAMVQSKVKVIRFIFLAPHLLGNILLFTKIKTKKSEIQTEDRRSHHEPTYHDHRT